MPPTRANLYGAMAAPPVSISPGAPRSSADFCREILPAVSRTFALNIPVLPPPLDLTVTVAYLLCRVADTLEDEVEGAVSMALLEELARLTQLPEGWREDARRFVVEAGHALRPQAPQAEARLLVNTARVLETLEQLPKAAHQHVATCVNTMAKGMGRMGSAGRRAGTGLGLRDPQETFRYCYVVAGIVGEMLTRLFAWYSPAVAERQGQLEPRSVLFGNALQLTNILKDAREDLERGCCWLPRTVLAEYELTPESLIEPGNEERVRRAYQRLIALAHGQLREALHYTLALPRQEKGIRLFCIWPLFLALMTLRKLHAAPVFFSEQPLKVSRWTVRWVMITTRLLAGWNAGLRALFALLAMGLPRSKEPEGLPNGEEVRGAS